MTSTLVSYLLQLWHFAHRKVKVGSAKPYKFILRPRTALGVIITNSTSPHFTFTCPGLSLMTMTDAEAEKVSPVPQRTDYIKGVQKLGEETAAGGWAVRG